MIYFKRMDIQAIKQRFGIIGNSPGLEQGNRGGIQGCSDRPLGFDYRRKRYREGSVSPDNPSVQCKETWTYIAVNCGAIPEGTIDSELFGHQKGAFTGAHESRSGYFEVADKGSIFLDEVSELPLSTQVRLLRVLETGEFMKGWFVKGTKNKCQDHCGYQHGYYETAGKGKFREDLYYRLNTVPVFIPPLTRQERRYFHLFRKFSMDFAEKYRMPEIVLDEDAGRC
jgi:transcriptional regulator with GAF, ATPase, and Fis domain